MALPPDSSKKEKADRISPESKEVLGRKPEGVKTETKPEGRETAPDSTKSQLEKLKPEFKEFTLYGIKILRERDQETNTIKFYEKSKDSPITNLQEWIKNKLKDAEKKKIEDGLMPYESLFKELSLSESEKQKRLKDLKESCFRLHEQGKTPQKLEDIPANINLVLKRLSVTQFSVDASAEKITIPYALVMPPNVSTIIITRENPKTKQKVLIVCVKYGEKGNEHFLEAETGKPVFLQPKDSVEIAAVSETQIAAVKAETVAAESKSSSSSPSVAGGGYAGGGGSGIGTGSSRSGELSSSESADKKGEKKEESRPRMTNQDIEEAKKNTKETKENYGTGDFNIRKIENREFNGGRSVYLCTFPPKLDPAKKTRFVLYLHGFGDASKKGPDMMQNAITMRGLDKSSKEKNENIVFVIPTGESEKSYFPEIASSQSRLENFINYCIYEAFDGKNTPQTKVDRYLMGHSGANYGMKHILDNASKNYFKGLGLFDSLYSKDTGKKFADLLKQNHPGTDVYSVYRQTYYPGENNPQLQAGLATKADGPKGHFEVAKTNDHGAIKYPGIPDALTYFAKEEEKTEQKKA